MKHWYSTCKRNEAHQMCLKNFGIVPRLWWPLPSFMRACRAKGYRSNHFRRPDSFRLCYAVRSVQRVLGYWQKMSAPNGPNGPQNCSLRLQKSSRLCAAPWNSDLHRVQRRQGTSNGPNHCWTGGMSHNGHHRKR